MMSSAFVAAAAITSLGNNNSSGASASRQHQQLLVHHQQQNDDYDDDDSLGSGSSLSSGTRSHEGGSDTGSSPRDEYCRQKRQRTMSSSGGEDTNNNRLNESGGANSNSNSAPMQIVEDDFEQPPRPPPPPSSREEEDQQERKTAGDDGSPKLGRSAAEAFELRHHEVENGVDYVMRQKEQFYRPRPDYLDWHPQINRRMRAVLFDWMVEVGQEYVLKRQTVHVAFFFVDQYLTNVQNVPRSMLQLVGVTALYIASKSEEIFPPRCSDFQLTTDGAYETSAMKVMELKMITVLNWRLTPITCYNWASFYLQKLFEGKREESPPPGGRRSCASEASASWLCTPRYSQQIIDRIMEVVDCAMLDIESVGFLPSMIAATAVVTHLLRSGMGEMVTRMEEICMYSLGEMEPCSEWLNGYSTSLAPNNVTQHTQIQHFVRDLPQTDWCTLQRHHAGSLALYKKYEEAQRERQEQDERAAQMQLELDREARQRSPSFTSEGDGGAESLETDEEL